MPLLQVSGYGFRDIQTLAQTYTFHLGPVLKEMT